MDNLSYVTFPLENFAIFYFGFKIYYYDRIQASVQFTFGTYTACQIDNYGFRDEKI